LKPPLPISINLPRGEGRGDGRGDGRGEGRGEIRKEKKTFSVSSSRYSFEGDIDYDKTKDDMKQFSIYNPTASVTG
jgi:hypothetical protein